MDGSFDRAPRLVLLDLKLPKVYGMEVLKRLKTDPRTNTIPVVILTYVEGRVRFDQGLRVGGKQLYPEAR